MGRESPGLSHFQQSQEQQRWFSLFFIDYILFFIDYLLFFIDYLLLFIVYSLLITVYSLLIRVYSLLIIFYSLLIIVYSLLIIYYSFLILVDILYLLVYIFSHLIHGNRGLGVEDRNSNPEVRSHHASSSFFHSKNRRKFPVITKTSVIYGKLRQLREQIPGLYGAIIFPYIAG